MSFKFFFLCIVDEEIYFVNEYHTCYIILLFLRQILLNFHLIVCIDFLSLQVLIIAFKKKKNNIELNIVLIQIHVLIV
jgi:hypothetical protein